VGEMLIEARETLVPSFIICSRIFVFPEEEAIKSLISLSSILSLIAKY